ncbi:MAG: hypothetical protein HYV40_05110 [Candidatus Levybacteria bacterium]|nr:hypothetical protein [Candidatus Levybacteria bacterium]
MREIDAEVSAILDTIRRSEGYDHPLVAAELITKRFPTIASRQHAIEKIIFESPTQPFVLEGSLTAVKGFLFRGWKVAGWTEDHKHRFGEVIGDLRRKLPHHLRNNLRVFSHPQDKVSRELMDEIVENAKEWGVRNVVVIDDELTNLSRAAAFFRYASTDFGASFIHVNPVVPRVGRQFLNGKVNIEPYPLFASPSLVAFARDPHLQLPQETLCLVDFNGVMIDKAAYRQDRIVKVGDVIMTSQAS